VIFSSKPVQDKHHLQHILAGELHSFHPAKQHARPDQHTGQNSVALLLAVHFVWALQLTTWVGYILDSTCCHSNGCKEKLTTGDKNMYYN